VRRTCWIDSRNKLRKGYTVLLRSVQCEATSEHQWHLMMAAVEDCGSDINTRCDSALTGARRVCVCVCV